MFGNPIFRLILLVIAFGRRKGPQHQWRALAEYLPGRLTPEFFAYTAMLVSGAQPNLNFLLTFGKLKVFSLLDRYSSGIRVVHPFTYDNYGWVFESVMAAIGGMSASAKAEFDQLCTDLWENAVGKGSHEWAEQAAETSNAAKSSAAMSPEPRYDFCSKHESVSTY